MRPHLEGRNPLRPLSTLGGKGLPPSTIVPMPHLSMSLEGRNPLRPLGGKGLPPSTVVPMPHLSMPLEDKG